MLKFAVTGPIECGSETGASPPQDMVAATTDRANSDYDVKHHCAVCEARRRTVIKEKTRAARRSRSRSKERIKQSLAEHDRTDGVESSPPMRRKRRSLSRERKNNIAKLKYIEKDTSPKLIKLHVCRTLCKADPVCIQGSQTVGILDSTPDGDISNCSEFGTDDNYSCFADSETSSLTSYDELVYPEHSQRGHQRVRFCEESIIRSELHEYKIAQITTAPPAYDQRLRDNRTFEICQLLNECSLQTDNICVYENEAPDALVVPIFIRYPVKSSERTLLKSFDHNSLIDPIDVDIPNNDMIHYTTTSQGNTIIEMNKRAIDYEESLVRGLAERASTDAKDIEELVLKSCFGTQKYLEMVTSDYESESVSSADSITTSKRKTIKRSEGILEQASDIIQQEHSLDNSLHEKDITDSRAVYDEPEFDLYNLTTKTTVLYPHKALSPGELSVQTGHVVYVDPCELHSKKIWVIAYMVSSGECGFIPKVNLSTKKMENIV